MDHLVSVVFIHHACTAGGIQRWWARPGESFAGGVLWPVSRPKKAQTSATNITNGD